MDEQKRAAADGRARVTILGARGSMPVSGAGYRIYGGATSCVLLETGMRGEHASQAVVFDAGSGLMNLPETVWREHRQVHVFLSHFHLDHLMGIPMSRMMFDETAEVIFYAWDGDRIREALERMMSEPIWPVGPEAFRAKVSYRSMDTQPVWIAGTEGSQPLQIRAMRVTHPGGAAAFRAEWGSHSMVYATDCEPDEQEARDIEQFAADTDLLIMDAQYTQEEYERFRGYGHSSMRTASQIMASGKVKKGLFFHHAPMRTDAQIAELEQQLQQYRATISFAKEGECIII